VSRKNQKNDEAEYRLKLPTAAGHTSVSVQVPRGPMRLAGLVPLAQMFTNLFVDKALEVEKKEGLRVSCRAGCAACCRQLVPVSAPEAFHLADYLIGLDEATRDRFIARFDEAESALDARGLMPRLEAIMRGASEATDFAGLAYDYFALGLSCPLLVDESCAAHFVRPLSCRDYNVTTPAEWCKSPTLHQIRKVPTPPLLSQPLARVTASLIGGAPELIPLPLAIRWVDTNPELGLREWPGTTLFEAWIAEIGVTHAT
jgi:Fe-S-cluster containining protein